MWGARCFLGTRCSYLPIVVAFVAEKLLVATAELIVRTVGLALETVASLLTEVLRSRLQLVALL